MEGFLVFSAAPTVRGEGELAFLSSSTDLGIVCWKTLGDSRTDDTAVVVAVTSGGPGTGMALDNTLGWANTSGSWFCCID